MSKPDMLGNLDGAWRANVQFILGVFIFVVVIGVMDARFPWPDPRSGRGKR